MSHEQITLLGQLIHQAWEPEYETLEEAIAIVHQGVPISVNWFIRTWKVLLEPEI
ncbi:MAG: hypothetical protein KME54_29470 [Tolypothrix brevis GSE-NOS-MK-07-07A]|nr:hypothetical protein [Tolypothrix brevis GSE-NOS-MK-07-07A]